jgi:hypothetical protein
MHENKKKGHTKMHGLEYIGKIEFIGSHPA